PMLEDYQTLWSELDPGDAAAMVEVLDKKAVPYRLTAGGSAIEVPESRLDETRLLLAGEGRLPKGGAFGFENFENMKYGATEFEQQIIYRRSMEGELARTITTIRDVKAARVHLVMPKRSVFVRDQKAATASVTVKLAPGAKLGPEQIAGIVHLVGSAVPDLGPGQISLVTTDGEMLHRPTPEGDDELAQGPLGQDQLSRQRAFEKELEEQALTLLEEIVGPGNAKVRIHADLDTAKVERKTDKYDPATVALRSHRIVIEGAGAGQLDDDTVAGVPGAESNLPTGEELPPEEAIAAPTPTLGGATRREEVKNHEVDHVQERRLSVVQDVKRLTVAVALDEVDHVVDGQTVTKPLDDAQVAAIRALVANAVGIDPERGDALEVTAMRFHTPALPEVAEEPPLLPIPEKYQRWVPLATRVALGLAILIALLVVRRKWRKHTEAKRAAAAEAEAIHEGEIMPDALKAAVAAAGLANAESHPELADEEDIAAKLADEKLSREAKLEALRTLALERARSDAPTAALVIRHWLGTAAEHEEREEAA
ncbi:MAG TPA: flagellar M-ring protein FliF, partial [Polyangiaceae bacterium]|nr:flagellar M-ring protein FliF [Polyangiaceae bacterium]